jgi:two-component system sensor histidine kinase PhoQ
LSESTPDPGAPSLASRLLLAATAVLVAFLGLTGLALDRAFRASVAGLARERLQARVYLLLAAADLAPDGSFTLREPLAEPRLGAANSGAFAAVTDADGNALWRSASSLAANVPYPEALGPGKAAFGEVAVDGVGGVLALTYPVVWELEAGGERYLVFHAAETRAGVDAETAGFRRALWLWLGGGALLLTGAQLAILYWSLSPLRRVSREVQDVEAGRLGELGGGYPRELRPLTGNLNRLLAGNRQRLKRYRDALADLAHSLKTPLAVLEAGLEEPRAGGDAELLREQVARMERTIGYQLQRAAASGSSGLSAPVDVLPAASRILRALEKLHAGRARPIEVAIDIDPGVRFGGDPGDLDEILGNLADNAFKWAAGNVSVSARNIPGDHDHPALQLEVVDDGPGIPETIRAEVLRRGVRLDAAVPGHGIGLAVVRDIVEQAYGGQLEILSGEPRGTRVRVLV